MKRFFSNFDFGQPMTGGIKVSNAKPTIPVRIAISKSKSDYENRK